MPASSGADLDDDPRVVGHDLVRLVDRGRGRDRRRHEEREPRRRLAVEPGEQPGRDRDPGAADSRHERECLGAADRQRLRERQVDGQQSARALALGEPQDAAADDEHQRDEPDFPEALLDDVVEEDADDQGGHRGDGDEPGEPPIRIALERSVADRREPGRDEPQPVGPEVDEERDQRPDMEHHAEGERRDERIVSNRRGTER